MGYPLETPPGARGMVRLERKAADSKGPDVPPEGGEGAKWSMGKPIGKSIGKP